MRKEDIKRHLKTYSVYQKRMTTINHAFASAIAPSEDYLERRVVEALIFLGQDPNGILRCTFCDVNAETCDHLVGLVKNGQLRGYGHQIGNLVPCCKNCNSTKGSKEFELFINESNKGKKGKADLIKLLKRYQEKFARRIELDNLTEEVPAEYEEFLEIKKQIFELMKRADEIAATLRKHILKN